MSNITALQLTRHPAFRDSYPCTSYASVADLLNQHTPTPELAHDIKFVHAGDYDVLTLDWMDASEAYVLFVLSSQQLAPKSFHCHLSP